jgi:hypothetical protein
MRLILDMVHHNPGEPRLESVYTDPAVLEQIGYNGIVYFLFDSPMLAINWESVDPDILPAGTPEREWTDALAARIRRQHAACRSRGLSVYAQSDMVLFPRRLIEKLGISSSFGDLGNKRTQALISAQVREAFAQFPHLDGLVVRIGETYLHDAPYHMGSIQNPRDTDQTIIPLIQLLRDEVCVRQGRNLVFRSWHSFDSNPDAYQRVSDAVEPHPKLWISIKHCEGDFHRANPFSRSIGQGRHRQIIEVQCAREYEGKGAYPNYIARGVISGFEEHVTGAHGRFRSIGEFARECPSLFGGIWTWSRGGGWGGPYVRNEMWCDVNAWILAQWARDPAQDEEAIFHRYASERLGLGAADIPRFRELCLMSADAVIRGRNSTHRDMDCWWTRDQGIGWPVILGDRARALREKDESVAMWKRIVALAESIEWPDEAQRAHAVGSCHYGLCLYEIYRVLVNLENAAAVNNRDSVARWIRAYDDAWAAYRDLPQNFAGLATLYAQDYRQHIRDPAHERVEVLRKTAV